MDRFFTFWSNYMDISADARNYITNHARIRQYKPKVFSYADDPMPYWCFVLEGLAAGIHYTADRQRNIRWLATPYHYFTGTEHPFTKRQTDVAIEFLDSSVLFLLRNEHAVIAQQRYPAVSELFHILKQHRINQLRKQVLLLQEQNNYERYRILVEELPEIVQHSNNIVQREVLQVSKGTFYRIKKRYLKRF